MRVVPMMMPVAADMDRDSGCCRRNRANRADSCQRNRAGQNNLLHAKLPVAEATRKRAARHSSEAAEQNRFLT
jgi:hypothetical protein